MTISDISRSQLFGRFDEGARFDDASLYTDGEMRIKELNIWSDAQVHGIRVIYTNGVVSHHGDKTGSFHRVQFEEDESIIGIEGKWGGNLDQLIIHTSKKFKKATYGPFATWPSRYFKVNFKAGRELKYIFGRTIDRSLENLGYNVASCFSKIGFADGPIPVKQSTTKPKQTLRFGAEWAKNDFNDRDVFEKEKASITAITVYPNGPNGYIKGLAVDYSSGTRREHGIVLDTSADKVRFDIDANDYISGVKIYAVNAIDQIEFFTLMEGSLGTVGKEPDFESKQLAKWNFHETFPSGSRLLYLEGQENSKDGLQNIRFWYGF